MIAINTHVSFDELAVEQQKAMLVRLEHGLPPVKDSCLHEHPLTRDVLVFRRNGEYECRVCQLAQRQRRNESRRIPRPVRVKSRLVPPLELGSAMPRLPDGHACTLQDAPLFDPYDSEVETTAEAHRRWQRALTICRRCPVLFECRQSADLLDGNLWGGVWGEQRLDLVEIRTTT